MINCGKGYGPGVDRLTSVFRGIFAPGTTQRAILSIAHVYGKAHESTVRIVKFCHITVGFPRVNPVGMANRQAIMINTDFMFHISARALRYNKFYVTVPVIKLAEQATPGPFELALIKNICQLFG